MTYMEQWRQEIGIILRMIIIKQDHFIRLVNVFGINNNGNCFITCWAKYRNAVFTFYCI